MSVKDNAIENHRCGMNCAQSVVVALGELVSQDPELLKNIAAGFGGGVNNGEICGACTGAVMALGLLGGDKASAGTLTKQLTREFREAFGGLRCLEVLGYDLHDPEHRRIISEQNLFVRRCRAVIAQTTQMAQLIIEECQKDD